MDAIDKPLTIASGGTISNYVETKSQFMGIAIPTLTASAVYVRGSSDNAGATSGRLQKEDGSGDFSVATDASGKFAVVPPYFPWKYIAVEAGAQGAARTFYLVGKS